VIPMMLYHIGKLPAFSRQMLKRKISVVVVGYPATPILTARVRFCVSAAHNKEDMDRVLAACDEIGDILDLKFSTGRMGAIERPLKGMRLADVKKYKSARKPVAPRWKLEDVIANGVRDAKIQLV
jgi:serine palmitoyltransferase